MSEYNQTCELWKTAHEHDHTNASQIYNIRNYEKAKRLGDTKMNLKEFIEWCENNSGIPDDEDEVFIQNRLIFHNK